MLQSLSDTIVAIASPLGGAARGIVRLSGPAVRQCLAQCFHAERECGWEMATAAVAIPGWLAWEPEGRRLPGEVFFWPNARSYTGEPAAEFHTLGSPPLLEAAVARFCRAGARLAEPGEFTLRAFLAGRIDLTQAEAVLGVIEAADGQQLDAALAQLAGGLARPLAHLRGELLDLLAEIEAGLDFPDEELPFVDVAKLERKLAEATATVARLTRQLEGREASGAAADVVLVGSPNAGKSSLFNALAGAAGALVSEQPGTTRDYLVAESDLVGVKCRWIDTAGVEGQGPGQPSEVHAAAQSMSDRQTRGAQLRLLCIEAGRALNDWERRELSNERPDRLVVLTKVDVVPPGEAPGPAGLSGYDVATSSATGAGIERLRQRVREALLGTAAANRVGVAGTASRCRDSLRQAAEALDSARAAVAAGLGEELIAMEIRAALDELGRVVGAVYTDDVLDVIFSRFCLGK